MISKNKTKRVCYVVCYKDPNYVRTQSLVGALNKLNSLELLVVKNKHRGVLRYLEVPFKLLIVRIRYNPDVFIVGFRAQEVFWLFYPSMIGKQKIFDEFINHHDWLVSEHKKAWSGPIIIQVLDSYMRWVVSRCKYVLTDTDAHAKLAEKTYKISKQKIKIIPVGTDESYFYPRNVKKQEKLFEVFFYGNMLPLHGLPYLIDAIKLLAANKQIENIHFTLVGGKGNREMLNLIADSIDDKKLEGHITHYDWLPFSELPNYIAKADLCIGGPFGNTGQAKRVITGKTYQFIAMAKATLIGEINQDTLFMNRHNCLLIKQGSARSIADAIVWASSNPKEIKIIGQNARKLFEKNFSASVISQQLQKLLIY